ncbi:glycosyl hydrolase family 18 protein [Dyella silvatica]|uniref:glycosyl hydrolase family 18 protein n=1 Tax=Dyella silvatica TaxID=2992128 RepID=UPI002250C5CA|nr:glycosyl hydrolase family 18 protein [Dyella silvatica]
MNKWFGLLLLSAAVGALPLAGMAQSTASTLPNTASSKRVVYYDQTIYNGSSSQASNYVSLSPLWDVANINPNTQKPYVTDVIVGAFHLGAQSDGTSLHLNDNPPSDAIFNVLWKDVGTLQGKGVNVLAMLGGAAQGSYASLFDQNGNLTTYYDTLKQALQTYGLNGIDLDIEESVSLANIETLITQLRKDFGSDFIITFAPVAAALQGDTDPFSGFNYLDLYNDQSANISWFNVQFYSGFGSLSSSTDYSSIVKAGFPANKVVAGMLSNSNNGSGFVSITTVKKTVTSLLKTYPDFGGVDAWEYYNANPGGTAKPALWGTTFGQLMNP